MAKSRMSKLGRNHRLENHKWKRLLQKVVNPRGEAWAPFSLARAEIVPLPSRAILPLPLRRKLPPPSFAQPQLKSLFEDQTSDSLLLSGL